jgi:hypothetical protein
VTRRAQMLKIAALGLAATLASGLPAWAQETPVTPDPVAQVGDVAIPLADYEHWFASAARSAFGGPVRLVPPAYERCVAAKRKLRANKRWAKLGEQELRARCARDSRMLRGQVMEFLIQGQWIAQEAAAQGIEVSDQRVDQAFERQKRAAFPTQGGYQRFLRETGASEADIKHRIRIDLLQTFLTRKVTGQTRPVTRRDVARYRSKHAKQFADMKDAEANRLARRLVHVLREQRGLFTFIESFRARWRAKTWCADGYKVAECGAIAP